jgi:DNA-binding CsgD family transcriptional regulator/tetratricopeptide (TPR) repeat protein
VTAVIARLLASWVVTWIVRSRPARAHQSGAPYFDAPADVLRRDGMRTRAFRAQDGAAHTRRVEGRLSGAFVGRGRELGDLEHALGATLAGRGTTVLVAGEAGIGKTRLAGELIRRARGGGFAVLRGRSIDLVGTELPYQPLVDALGPLWTLPQVDDGMVGSQLRLFHESAARLFDRADEAPVLLVLEDLHWADTSTLDLVVFLAHNIQDRPVLLLATYRPDESTSSARMRRLAEGVRRSGRALRLELGPLTRDELTALLATHTGPPRPAALTDAILARSEGNPFFAEELLASASASAELPRGLRDLLLQRVTGLDRAAHSLLRLAAAAGRDVGYPLLLGAAERPEAEVLESLRQAVEHGVLLADQANGTFRFRHALLAEAVYATILPGEREDLHGRLADQLARASAAAPAELASHWAAAGRPVEALTASVDAARQAEAIFGLAETLAHLERAVALWPTVPDAAERVGIDLAELCFWAANLAGYTGASPRAVELTRRAIELVGDGDPHRAARLHAHLGRHQFASGRADDALRALERAVALVPASPPSRERAEALSALASGLNCAWRHEESRAIGEQALALARAVGDHAVESRARTMLGHSLVYLGHGEEGLATLWQVLREAESGADPIALERAYIALTDVLATLGRPRECARLAESALEALRTYGGRDHNTLLANRIEALVACGEWDEADRVSAAALRAAGANYPHQTHIARAELEVGRGDFDAARAHLEAAGATLRLDRDLAAYAVFVAELALWERRWTDVEQIVDDGLARTQSGHTALIRVWLCAKGLRAQADLAALARARRDGAAVRDRIARARRFLTTARRAAVDAAGVTPLAAAWLAQAEAEHQRASGVPRPDLWSAAADGWHRLERPPLAAYCRWRQAEALVAAGANRDEAGEPLRKAYAQSLHIGARPLGEQLELLAQRARLALTPPDDASSRNTPGLEEILGLTPREAEVLALVARGHTNREIAATLVISVRTAGVHVSHILRKLGAPNRVEAAAIAHRAAPAVVLDTAMI